MLTAASRGAITRWISSLRFPWLVAIAAAVFFADLVVPDFLPFVDEILLALLTAGLAMLRKKRRPAAATPAPRP
jgi:hypothetical protein